MYVRKAIENLLQHKDIKRSSHHELKLACEEALKALEASSNQKVDDHSTNDPVDGEKSPKYSVLPEPNPSCVQVETFFLPFELACQSKTSKIVCSALDSIEKLVAYGHISYQHFGDDSDYAIYDTDPSQRQDLPPLFDDHLTATVANCFSGPHTDEGIQVQVLKALLSIVTSGHIRVHENSLLLAVRTCYNIFLASKNLNYQATAKATLSQILSCVFARMEVACRNAADEAKRIEQEKAALNPENESNSLDDEGAEVSNYDLILPMVLEMVDKVVDLKGGSSNRAVFTASRYASLMQKDCFLVFRSLCKLSMKPLPDGYPDPRSHELRSKILSLQLLLGILQNGGEAFCNDEIFVSAIKSYLCVALSQNGVSNISEVFELSIALFIELLAKYKRHLKSQVEIFFKEICLNILEAATSSFEQKWLVIEAIAKICSDAQMVVDIYVNYDCDLSAANIFERLVDIVSKIARGRQAFEIGATPNQLRGIRTKGLECLVCILKCMVEWSKDLYINPHIQLQSAEIPKHLKHVNLCLYQQTLDISSSSSVAPTISLTEEDLQASSFLEDPSKFEQVKQYKLILEHGIRLFSQKPSKGIQFFKEKGLIEDSLESVAKFLLAESDRLDKTAIGEYLGELENKDTMHHYVDQMNFTGKEFVKALRHFLEGFRLPGEAQKIDRLMEKFASRYFECCPKHEHFASADTAYVLAYSIIMLTTDLHSSSVKKKMTKEEFVRNNRGINESEDLPSQYLSQIYEEIASEEIKMRPTSTQVGKNVFVTDAKRRQEIWCQESANITKTAEALMESAASNRSQDLFVTARHLEHIRPMFKLVWSPALAAFSVGLQDSDEVSITQPSLEGIQCAIRIACIFGAVMERNAFVQALARFTLLTDNANVAEIKSKNVESIKTIISVAYSDGNYLEGSWLDVMKCISQLEVAQNLGTNLNRTSSVSSGINSGINSTIHESRSPFPRSSSVVSGLAADPQHGQIFRETMSQASSQSVVVAVDRIFTGSRNLNGDAIVHFVKALCQVSKDEVSVSHQHQPRMFCLNKLVEISYYNMERIRLEWSRIWQVLGNHFNVVGCNDSQSISIFAVDSLRQLSLKFLEKGELQNFHFQKDFLRPFEFIMKNNKSGQIRDMVVRCISQMVQSQAGNIKSGWKNIFAAFALAASDSDENIVALSFQSTTQIVSEFLDDKLIGIIDSAAFQDCVKCLSEFACNPLFPDVSMEAIRLIRRCAKYVSDFKTHFVDDDDSGGMESVWIRGWFPVLFELSCIINTSKLDIRTRSLTILFDIVKHYGDQFERNWWLDLFRVLFRVFDVVKKGDIPKVSLQHKEWMDTTCNHTLYAMTDVFNEFFTQLAPILLEDMLGQFKWCVQQDNDQLSRSAVSCLENLILTNRPKMSNETEHLVLAFLSDIIAATLLPHGGALSNGDVSKLSQSIPIVPQTTSAKSLRQRVQVHLEILHSTRRIVFGISMSKPGENGTQNGISERRLVVEEKVVQMKDFYRDVMNLVDSLLYSHQVARSYLSDSYPVPLSDATLLPMLVKQETDSLKCGAEILLELYTYNSPSVDFFRETETKLLSVLAEVLHYFLTITSKNQQESWTPLLCLIFNHILNLNDAGFCVTVPVLYNHICDILSVSLSSDLRITLCNLLKRIGLVYKIVQN